MNKKLKMGPTADEKFEKWDLKMSDLRHPLYKVTPVHREASRSILLRDSV